MRRQRQRGFTLIELMVGSIVTFITVLAVSAAFLGYTQSFYTQAGIRGGQASLRHTHQLVVRNLRMAGYGMDPPNAFGFPAGWRDDATRNRSDRLVFRMRDPAFATLASAISGTTVTLPADKPLPALMRKGQIFQIACPGGLALTYVQLSADAPAGAFTMSLESPTGTFPRLNNFSAPCFGIASGGLPMHVFKIDVYDYSIQFVDDDGMPATPGRPYLFRRHGLDEKDPNAFGEPVAEDIEALRVIFLRENGTEFIPNPGAEAPDYGTPLNDPKRLSDHPANIRAVRVGLVARTSTRDAGINPGLMNLIPKFGGRPELPGAYGFRRVLSEMSVQIRNMRSAQLPVPIYSNDAATVNACKGAMPDDELNCAGG
ncbi:prepilin-type N-terminal cleavage/methylation domain-containing protein [Archangium sp.]|jgi:type IV pilus assembly protein PilW|uniref:prepilin-type N-terminal cleavage/methylation domain-containing protein n=1 Tax=Archangium sp. TaxID=1872627 RepID=UPI002ED8D9E5